MWYSRQGDHMSLIISFRDSIFRPMADPMIDIGEVFLDTVF